MFSQSEENYIKTIYHLSLDSKEGVSTNAIAKKIDTKASSVTDMIKKLSEKKLINYIKYQGVRLTTEGRELAIQIIRKHRLWEVFLVDKLNFSWDEVHDVAEQLEHIRSDKLITELDRFLGFPKRDPHGDSIPDEDGNIDTVKKMLLANCNEGDKVECIGVNDTSADFLKFLSRKGIKIGKGIKIIEKEDFDDSMLIEIENQKVSISNKISNNIYIKKI